MALLPAATLLGVGFSGMRGPHAEVVLFDPFDDKWITLRVGLPLDAAMRLAEAVATKPTDKRPKVKVTVEIEE